jgi:TonB family protein
MQGFVKLASVMILAAGAVSASGQCAATETTADLNGKSVSCVPADAKSIPAAVLSKNVVSDLLPDYPEAALKAHIGGLVLAIVIVGKDGHVEKVPAIDGPQLFKQASADAILRWKYQPILVNGEPVRAISTVILSFTIAGDSGQPKVSHIPFVARISGGVAQGFRLTFVPPVYPAEAKKKHISGTVVTHVLIGIDGKIVTVDALSGPAELRDAAVDAVRQWTYKPYLLNGNPTPVETTITLNFNLTQ